MRHSSKHIVYGTEGLEVVHDGHHLASTAPQVLPYGSELAQRGAGLEVAPVGLEVTPYGSEQAQRGAGLQAVQPGLILCDEEKLGGLERSSSSLSSASSDSVGKEKVLPPRPKDGRICGFRRKPFFVLLAFAIFMVLALALGLGLGLMFGLQRAANPTPNPTPTTTTAANTSTISSSLPNTAINNATMATTMTTATSGGTTAAAPTAGTTTSAQKAQPTVSASTSASASIKTLLPVATPGPNTNPNTNANGPTTSCPGSDGTTFVLSGSTFKIACDSSLSGPSIKPMSVSTESSFNDCIAHCASMNFFQSRTDINAVYTLAAINGNAAGSCLCVGGLGANVTRTLGNMPGSDVALIQ